MREMTDVMPEQMAEQMAEQLSEQVQDTCGQVQDTYADTCDDSYTDWPRFLEPVWALPRDIEVIYYAVTKHGFEIRPGDDAYNYLVRRLERGSDEERAMAIEVLGCMEDTAALWRLRDVALHDQNPKLRARALVVACACFGVQAIDAVCAALQDSATLVRYTAERLLLDLYRNADTEVRQRIFEYLVYRLRDMV